MAEFKIPYGRQSIDDDDIKAVLETLTDDFLTQGPRVAAFEEAFAEYVGSKYAVAVSSATAALHISVIALDLKEGDRIITTPITFAASANCAQYVGAEVWFADIDPDTYLLDIEKVRALIESKPEGFFKGIIPVDFAGLPVDIEAFRALADQHGLWLIEDACHAPGGWINDSNGTQQKVGNGVYADLSIFSFHPVKHIASGEGGMITTNSQEQYDRLMRLRTHGISKKDMSRNEGGWYYEMHELGYNYRLTDLQSALGRTQLLKNDWSVELRNDIARKYKAVFDGKLKYQSLPDGRLNAHHLFVIEIEDRKGMYNHLHANGIFAQVHYIPVHQLPYYAEQEKRYDDLSKAEKYYSGCLSIPMFPTLKDEEQEYVIEKVLEFLNA